MPTGYTAKIHDGKEVSTKEFIMDCSRAFGALIMMRDQPADAPIPERFEPSMYSKEKAEDCKKQLERFENLSEKEAFAEMEAWYQEKCDREYNHYQKSIGLAERYNHTLEEVQLWNPPTSEHEELKQFCLKQLQESLKFDCIRAVKPYFAPEKPNLSTWIKTKTEDLKRDIAYHENSYQEEVERTKKRNEWLKQLRESLNDI